MSTRTLTLLFVVLLAAPAAQAYGIRGDNEPSTRRDAQDGYMWTTVNKAAANKVYFNGFSGLYVGYTTGVSTTVNPNFATVASAHQDYPYRAFAMLGIWRDCNEDGYVGLGDNAVLEYSSKLLTGTSVCPVQSIPDKVPRNWLPIHNDGTLVREFLPIGWDYKPGSAACPKSTLYTCSDVNVFNVNDSDARVWADWDLPGAAPGTQCYVRPHPRGTWHSVGGVQTWADCFANNKIINAINGAGLGPTYNGVKGSDCDNSYVLAGYHTGCNPWGETKQDSYVDAFDCQEGNQLVETPQDAEVNGQSYHIGSTVNVSNPRSAPGFTTRGSVAGTLNETSSDFDDCRANNRGDPGLSAEPYALEGDIQNQNGRRFQHDQVLYYDEGIRPSAPVPVYQAVVGPSGPEDFGVGTRGVNSFEGFWVGTSITAASRNPYLNRDTVQPMQVTYTTFYATIGAAAQSRFNLLVPGSVGAYGSEACGTIGAGQSDRNGWACDPAAWWPNDAAGKKTMPDVTISVGLVDYGVKVGQTYQLRDVDCWDESVGPAREQGVGFGIFTNSQCQ